MLTTMLLLITLVSLLLMAAVLIQNPKGGGVDPTFGGSANQMFGAAKSTDFIEKITWGLAIALFALCIITTLIVGSQGGAQELLSQ